ncbi:hypothetical protein [uncultured Dysosmobacter sp.]|uniref:hypothetical protein n=1 Tax=uncultured Dysosmobacter sp. TaxID=2591384 RepID=UPI00263663D7|nr:hypothetical protein [uncultured Dysosmobacter sp.]
MGQIIWNWTWIAVMPLLLGGAVRLLCRRWSKAWLVTAAAALLAAAAYIAALDPPVRGSELYGLRTVMAVFLTAGSLTAAVILRVKNKRP